jgi:hypothetical protein
VLAAAAAGGVALLSLVYAVAYLVIAPSAQRGSDVEAFFRSYLDHPFGMRLASACLAVSGILSGVAVVALADWLRGHGHDTAAVRWGTIAGVAGALLTSVHGMADLLEVDRLAHRFASGDAAMRAAVVTAHSLPSAVDPRGLVTFGIAGLVAVAFGAAFLERRRTMALIGVIYGADLVALFVATALSVNAAVLLTGGLASVVLGPVWWLLVASTLRAPAPSPTRSEAAAQSSV